VSDGDLYICGRQKDLMIVRGRNLHPQDLELEVGAVAGVRTGNVVAFSAPRSARGAASDKAGEGEVAVVVAELDPKAPRRLDDVRRDVIEAVSAAFQLALAEVVLLPSGSIPKTSSGKLQRGLVRQAWIDGELAALAPPGAVATRLLQARLGLASAWRKAVAGGARSLVREGARRARAGGEPASSTRASPRR
jgi:acyl-CoA synthetase (AMP-forming)/AMP-acid ligase II